VVADRAKTARQVACLIYRADNCVKNHFYSKLRKAARKLNKIIEEYFASQFAELKSSTLSEIIEITESKFKMNSKIDE
jgi:hypothetical protein